MTKDEPRVSKTDAVMFSDNFNYENQPNDAPEATVGEVEIEEQSIKIELKDRFARLKKSLRKRSVSIL